jgi:RNA polymerase sigma-70 factor (ECF subfamily)
VFSDSLREQLAGVLPSERTRVSLQDEVAQLFEEMREGVYRYVLSLGLYPPQAQEATQEVFLRLYAVLKRGEAIENRRAWVVRVAHNLGLNLRAQQSSQAPFESNIEMRLKDPQLNPEQSLLARERLLRFHWGVENLSEQQRRCLHLRLEGLRYPEIAAVLGISASAVGEFLRRAIVRLRKVIHE